MSYSTLMASLEPASQWALALCHFALAPELDGTAWNAAMTACKRGAQWQMAIALLAKSPSRSPKPLRYLCLIKASKLEGLRSYSLDFRMSF